jgi:hypothetical protein
MGAWMLVHHMGFSHDYQLCLNSQKETPQHYLLTYVKKFIVWEFFCRVWNKWGKLQLAKFFWYFVFLDEIVIKTKYDEPFHALTPSR